MERQTDGGRDDATPEKIGGRILRVCLCPLAEQSIRRIEGGREGLFHLLCTQRGWAQNIGIGCVNTYFPHCRRAQFFCGHRNGSAESCLISGPNEPQFDPLLHSHDPIPRGKLSILPAPISCCCCCLALMRALIALDGSAGRQISKVRSTSVGLLLGCIGTSHFLFLLVHI